MSVIIVSVSLVLSRVILRLLPSNGKDNNVLDCIQTDYLTGIGSIVYTFWTFVFSVWYFLFKRVLEQSLVGRFQDVIFDRSLDTGWILTVV